MPPIRNSSLKHQAAILMVGERFNVLIQDQSIESIKASGIQEVRGYGVAGTEECHRSPNLYRSYQVDRHY